MQPESFALGQGRQGPFLLLLGLVGPLDVELHEAGEADHLAAGAQGEALAGGDVDGGGVEDRRGHLRGDGARPDQLGRGGTGRRRGTT